MSDAALRSGRPVSCARVSGRSAIVFGGSVCLSFISAWSVVSLWISLRAWSVVQPKSCSRVLVCVLRRAPVMSRAALLWSRSSRRES